MTVFPYNWKKKYLFASSLKSINNLGHNNIDKLTFSVDLLSQIGALAGSLSLATLSDAGLNFAESSSGKAVDQTVFTAKCFNLFCQAAGRGHADLRKLAGKNRGEVDEVDPPPDVDVDEEKLLLKVVADLNAARVAAR